MARKSASFCRWRPKQTSNNNISDEYQKSDFSSSVAGSQLEPESSQLDPELTTPVLFDVDFKESRSSRHHSLENKITNKGTFRFGKKKAV